MFTGPGLCNYTSFLSSKNLSYSSLARRRLLPHWGQKRERSYSAFRTAKAFSMSSKLTIPPHIRCTYSGVMPARSIEQERISFSINCRSGRAVLHSQCYSSYCRCIYGRIWPANGIAYLTIKLRFVQHSHPTYTQQTLNAVYPCSNQLI